MEQVAGGTDLVRKALSCLAPQSMSTLVLVDVLANDGWPALAALEDSCGLVKMYLLFFGAISIIVVWPYQGISFYSFNLIGWDLHRLTYPRKTLPDPA